MPASSPISVGRLQQLAQDFLLLRKVRLSCELGDVLTLLGFVWAWEVLQGEPGCRYAVAVVVSMPLLANPECHSGCLSCF